MSPKVAGWESLTMAKTLSSGIKKIRAEASSLLLTSHVSLRGHWSCFTLFPLPQTESRISTYLIETLEDWERYYDMIEMVAGI